MNYCAYKPLKCNLYNFHTTNDGSLLMYVHKYVCTYVYIIIWTMSVVDLHGATPGSLIVANLFYVTFSLCTLWDVSFCPCSPCPICLLCLLRISLHQRWTVETLARWRMPSGTWMAPRTALLSPTPAARATG